jgi:hypothetical protein
MQASGARTTQPKFVALESDYTGELSRKIPLFQRSPSLEGSMKSALCVVVVLVAAVSLGAETETKFIAGRYERSYQKSALSVFLRTPRPISYRCPRLWAASLCPRRAAIRYHLKASRGFGEVPSPRL